MPDYAACKEHKCPKRVKCARYLMIPSGYQTYILPKELPCDSYWNIDKKPPPFPIRDKDKL